MYLEYLDTFLVVTNQITALKKYKLIYIYSIGKRLCTHWHGELENLWNIEQKTL